VLNGILKVKDFFATTVRLIRLKLARASDRSTRIKFCTCVRLCALLAELSYSVAVCVSSCMNLFTDTGIVLAYLLNAEVTLADAVKRNNVY